MSLVNVNNFKETKTAWDRIKEGFHFGLGFAMAMLFCYMALIILVIIALRFLA